MHYGDMIIKPEPGLGELLRYLSELVDQGAEEHYRARALPHYRPRYTPVLRALAAGAETVSDITGLTHLTQGAVSQSVALMVGEGLLDRRPMEDARKSGLRLTAKGKALVRRLEPHWSVTFAAIEQLEHDIGYPLRDTLAAAAAALAQHSFSSRLETARQHALNKESPHER